MSVLAEERPPGVQGELSKTREGALGYKVNCRRQERVPWGTHRVGMSQGDSSTGRRFIPSLVNHAGSMIYRGIHVVRLVKIVIKCQDEILFVQHSYGRKEWTLPGGGVKKKESLEDATKREVREEVGILLDEVMLKGSFLYTQKDFLAALLRGVGGIIEKCPTTS